MIASTRGIVLHTTPYSDSTVIAKIYTEEFGLRSYLVNAAHSKRSGTKSRLLQPLSLVELVVYEKERSQLQRVKEIRTEIHFSNAQDISRTSILLFLDEVLCHVIREEEKNPLLFEFLHSSIQILDLLPGSTANFHLSFLVQLSKYLGFFPQGNYTSFCPLFDLKAGEFIPERPIHPNYLEARLSERLFQLMQVSYDDSSTLSLTAVERKELLKALLYYYSTHIDSFPALKSHLVLEEVLGE